MKLPEPAQLKTDIENRVGIETVQNHMRAYGKQCAREALEEAAKVCDARHHATTDGAAAAIRRLQEGL